MDISPSEDTKEVIPEKPKQVRIAINILYILLVFVAINTALNSYDNYRFSENFPLRVFLCWVIIVPAYLLLVFKSSKGKAWARNYLLIWYILYTYGYSKFLNDLLPTPLFIFSIFLGIVGLVATILLYIGPSKTWFEYHKQMKKS